MKINSELDIGFDKSIPVITPPKLGEYGFTIILLSILLSSFIGAS